MIDTLQEILAGYENILIFIYNRGYVKGIILPQMAEHKLS